MFIDHDVFLAGQTNQFKGIGLDDRSARLVAETYMNSWFNKGLSATGTVAVGGTTGGDALKLQDLQKQIATAALTAKSHARFLASLKQVQCFSDVVEKTLREGYGGFRGGGFLNASVASGGLSSADPSLTRETLQVQWMGGRFNAFRTLLALKAQGIDGDPVTGNGMNVVSDSRLQQLLLDANYQALHGDPGKNIYEMAGAIQQIRVTHDGQRWICRYNMGGQPLNPDVMPDLEEILQSKGGEWNRLWIAPTARADFRKFLNNQIRIGSGVNITTGVDIDNALIEGLSGEAATCKVTTELFLNALAEPTYAEGPQPPVAPASVTTGVTSTNALNVWGSYLPAGIYNYSAVAVGANGRGVPVLGNASVTADGSHAATVTIVNSQQVNLYDIAFFEIYRGNGSTGKRQYLGRVAANNLPTGNSVVFTDNGEFVPGCTTGLALTNRANNHVGGECLYRQLFPTTKVGLPNDVMAEQGAWLTAGTVQIMVPQFCLVIENIGRFA